MDGLMVLAAVIGSKEPLEKCGVVIREEDHVIGHLKFAWHADRFQVSKGEA
jgi:hypothetical protein